MVGHGLVQSREANNIFVQGRSGVARNLTNSLAVNEWARWSPDGKQIVFDSRRDGGVFEIYVMNADGSGVTELTTPPLLGRYASRSPDGTQIVFRRGIDIYAIKADGSGTPVQPTSELAPRLRADARLVPGWAVYRVHEFPRRAPSVFRMNADGSDQTNLTPKNLGDQSTSWRSRAPSWSANGQEIFFVSFRPSTGGMNQIFVMDADGTNVRQLTDVDTNGSPRAR
jgi:TolB protein